MKVRPFGPYPIDTRLLLGFLALAGLALGFLKFASEVLEGDTLAFDRWFLLALRQAGDVAVPRGPDWVAASAVDLTALGGTTVLTLVTILVGLYLLVSRKAAMALFVGGAVGAGAIFGLLLKALFDRPRPDIVPHLVEVTNASFPSGHAMNSAIVYLTLAALLARAEGRWSVRIFLLGAGMALTLVIGLTRLYLGVHWPTDVLAGWCVGAGWAFAASWLARLLQARRQIEQPTGETMTTDTVDKDEPST